MKRLEKLNHLLYPPGADDNPHYGDLSWPVGGFFMLLEEAIEDTMESIIYED